VRVERAGRGQGETWQTERDRGQRIRATHATDRSRH
jgi:hypothetical protein